MCFHGTDIDGYFRCKRNYLDIREFYENVVTPWRRGPFKNILVTHLVKKSPAFRRTPRFITVFTRSHHRCVSCARSIQSTTSYGIFPTSTLILSFLLCRGLQSDLFPLGFYTKNLHKFIISPTLASSPADLILIDLVILII